MTLRLRDYQTAAVEAATAHLAQHRCAIIEMATGTGKSAVIAALTKHYHDHTLIICCTSRTLIEQNRTTLVAWNAAASYEASTEQRTNERNWLSANPYIIINTIQSLSRKDDAGCARREAIPKDRPFVVIIDECHIGPKQESAYYGFFVECVRSWGETKLIGLSATPYRTNALGRYEQGFITQEIADGNDGYAEHRKYPYLDLSSHRLCTLWDAGSLVYRYGYRQALAEGYIVPFIWQKRSVHALVQGLEGAKVTRDLETDEMEVSTREQERAAEGAMSALTRYIVTLHARVKAPVLVYMPGVKTSKMLAKALSDAGLRAKSITSSPDLGLKKRPAMARGRQIAERDDELIQQFKSGELDVLVNMHKLTTGFDFPALEHIVLARQVRSRLLIAQIFGRGTRPSQGKTQCTVYDVAGSWGYQQQQDSGLDKDPSRIMDTPDPVELPVIREQDDLVCRCGMPVTEKSVRCESCGFPIKLGAKGWTFDEVMPYVETWLSHKRLDALEKLADDLRDRTGAIGSMRTGLVNAVARVFRSHSLYRGMSTHTAEAHRLVADIGHDAGNCEIIMRAARMLGAMPSFQPSMLAAVRDKHPSSLFDHVMDASGRELEDARSVGLPRAVRIPEKTYPCYLCGTAIPGHMRQCLCGAKQMGFIEIPRSLKLAEAGWDEVGSGGLQTADEARAEAVSSLRRSDRIRKYTAAMAAHLNSSDSPWVAPQGSAAVSWQGLTLTRINHKRDVDRVVLSFKDATGDVGYLTLNIKLQGKENLTGRFGVIPVLQKLGAVSQNMTAEKLLRISSLAKDGTLGDIIAASLELKKGCRVSGELVTSRTKNGGQILQAAIHTNTTRSTK